MADYRTWNGIRYDKEQIVRCLKLDKEDAEYNFFETLEFKIFDLVDIANGLDEVENDDEFFAKKADAPYSYETEKLVQYVLEHPRTTEAGLLREIKKQNKLN